MTRVLLVSNYAWTVFNFRRNLIQALEAAKCSVYVQTEFDGYEHRLGVDHSRVVPLRINRKGTNPFEDALTLLSIHSAIGSLRPDVCLFFTIKPILYGGLASSLRKVPFICNVTGLGAAFDRSRLVRFIVSWLYRLVLKRSSRVFFQNNDDLSSFIDAELVATERASLLPGSGVDLRRFSVAPYPANSSPTFLLVARLLWSKGIGEYVEAARRIKRTHPNARFMLLGPTGAVNPAAISREQVEQLARDGSIEYLGETDDVYPHLTQADCVVLPSYYREGVPRSLLEAAAVGRPVITTDRPGCRDIVDDGVTGLVCKAKDVNDLVRVLEKFIALPVSTREEMGRRGRLKVEDRFDERVVLDRYLAEIRNLSMQAAVQE